MADRQVRARGEGLDKITCRLGLLTLLSTQNSIENCSAPLAENTTLCIFEF